jgi:RHS repeat-associated protein
MKKKFFEVENDWRTVSKLSDLDRYALRAMQANDNPEKLQYYYHSDHLGSSSLITDLDGNVAQHIEYVPFGEVFIEERNSTWNTPYKFNAKELDEETGLYYYGARYYDPRISIWYGADPLQEKYPGISTYCYTANNPVKFVDLDGKSTHVKNKEDGTYTIIGGDLEDNDLNIYVYTKDKNGDYTVQGNSIGVTTSITSFYDSYANEDGGAWAVGSILNPNDNSGDIFLQGLLSDDPSLVGYMWNATRGEKYDFKATNNTGQVDKTLDWYRGMPITNTEFTTDNLPTYTSAKDIGNIAAGYVAATKGLTWEQARAGFDGLQKVQDRSLRSVERPSTQNAQRYGFSRGERRVMINNSRK